MRTFLGHWLATAIALMAADWMLDGVHVGSALALAFGALLLGLVNALVRPVLVLLTLPITILTLGLFYLVINGVAFALASALAPGFSVSSFGSAVAGALVVTLVSWGLSGLTRRSRAARPR